MIAALILVPTVAGLLAFALPSRAARRGLLVLAALGHAGLSAASWASLPAPTLEGWLVLDAPGRLFLSLASALFLATAVYAVSYLRREAEAPSVEPEQVFIGCLLLFLAAMTLVTTSHHFGLLWVAVEATTLASAPLIYFHKHASSLEATWKYLLICSVGIGLALLGNFFLAVAASNGGAAPLLLSDLIGGAKRLHAPWLQAAFLCLLVGYGTKMGLAPLHTWLPDAHSESPSAVSALLSGALLNCAFLGILRALQVCSAAGLDLFARRLLLGFGILSMTIAAVFLLRSFDYKRMLAYSSVEHMGILSIGIGIGGLGTFAAMFHAVNHSLTKGMLFLAAGNILAVYKTKNVERVQGVLRTLPVTGVLWLAGFLAITGSPPFGSFLSELMILRAAFEQGRTLIGIAFLALLALAFVGMAGTMLRMAQGESTAAQPAREEALRILPPMALAAAVLLLGVYLPPQVGAVLQDAARALGGTP